MAKTNKKVTTEDLARMVKNGFDQTAIKQEMAATRQEMKEGFKEINSRLDRIENSILKQHAHQIAVLEKRINRIESALAIK